VSRYQVRRNSTPTDRSIEKPAFEPDQSPPQFRSRYAGRKHSLCALRNGMKPAGLRHDTAPHKLRDEKGYMSVGPNLIAMRGVVYRGAQIYD